MKKIQIGVLVLAPLLLLGACGLTLEDTPKSGANELTAFNFSEPGATGVISESTRHVTVSFPYGTDLTSLVPTITHTGQSISPASGVANDFSSDLIYVVTAEDGYTKVYTIVASERQSSEKTITNFDFSNLGALGTVSEFDHTISVAVPSGTDVSSLAPTVGFFGQSLSPASGTSQNFTNDIVYTVTADDGTIQQYTVSVSVQPAASFTASGKVVNIKQSPIGQQYETSDGTQSLVGATVTFTDKDSTDTYTATVGGAGTYSIADIPSGTYSITATKAGWAFVPNTLFSVTRSTNTAPDLLAFASTEAGSITVAVSWTNRTTDVDLHMVWGTMGAGTSANRVYYGNQAHSATGPANFNADLERDITGAFLSSVPLVETITLSAATGAITPNDSNYSNVGLVNVNNTFRFYIDAFDLSSGISGDVPSVAPAGATVYVFQGTTHLGSYYAPFNTAERTLQVLKVAFDGTASNNFVVYTELTSAAPGIFRSVAAPVTTR